MSDSQSVNGAKYDKPRKPINGHRERVAPNGYKSIQKELNSDNGRLNVEKFNEYVDTLTKDGWLEFPLNNVPKYIKCLSPGMRVSYITNDNLYRSGGYLIDVHLSEEDEYYAAYKGFNGAVWHVQFNDISHLYFQDANKIRLQKKIAKENAKAELRKQKEQNRKQKLCEKELSGPKPVKFRRPRAFGKAEYAVTIPDQNGIEVPVFYGRNNQDVMRFMSTAKFLKALNTKHWTFVDDDDDTNTEVSSISDRTTVIRVNLD
jgi:hypothetical protein